MRVRQVKKKERIENSGLSDVDYILSLILLYLLDLLVVRPVL